MEVGAVKQAFNNEIILLKKNLNQAKIQTIHKLTRKAKTLTDKKGPEALKDKQKRKAESAVREVLIIKKIKARDIARFIVTHTGKLNEYLNKPLVDENKACARLLLHKALQEKYKHIREKFINISIKDLFMSRQERKNLKKEEREKQKNKKKGKNKSNTVNVEGEWDVENTDKSKEAIKKGTIKGDNAEDDEAMSEEDEMSEIDDRASENSSTLSNKSDAGDNSDGDEPDQELEELNNKEFNIEDKDSDSDGTEDKKISKKVKKDNKNKIDSFKPSNEIFELKINGSKKISEDKSKKGDRKIKDNKNKNLNEKLHKRNFNKESDDLSEKVTKIVDPFFVTSTGENYMSLVEPRNPDEVKEVHKEGNRKYRRAVMFGHVPKAKPRKNNYQSNNNFNQYENYENNKPSNKNKEFGNRQNNLKRHEDRGQDKKDEVPEKLHPSWEAKKKQSGLLPFTGKKIVFD
ncbi:serum response factor-binding protein 1 [Vanessa cardui]|uniref:serum response factor-binding protein 1 n=1 Tax=Vanessa cardui TaxID=171605 RepID=UPI001F12CF91|nr:serum response factor-binding protein 1 [Vanessa cardui]